MASTAETNAVDSGKMTESAAAPSTKDENNDNDDDSSPIVSFLSELSSEQVSDLQTQLESFIVPHAVKHRPIALVTSGGTVADLEINSVRCIDNFSTGLRGAIAVEQFLKKGYAVVHLQRTGSASPFARVLSMDVLQLKQANHGISASSLGKLFNVGDVEDNIQDELVQAVLRNDNATTADTNANNNNNNNNGMNRKNNNGIELHRKVVHSSRLQQALQQRSVALKEGRLLTIPFRSVEEYLAKLQLCAEALNDCQSLALCYMAAAVSDYYIPKSQRSQHKIQSSSNTMELTLQPVPKMLKQLQSKWAPNAFICGFKLETDMTILRSKAERMVNRDSCHLVIGNILSTRHEQVWVLCPPNNTNQENQTTTTTTTTTTTIDATKWHMQEISKPRGDDDPDSLEALLLDFVMQNHFAYISNHTGYFHYSNDAYETLEMKRKRLERKLFWQQVQRTGFEWAGVAIGAGISYWVSQSLRSRLNP